MSSEQVVHAIRIGLEIIGGFTILFTLLAGLVTSLGWTAGVFVIFKRLGLGRWYRRVLIVGASAETKSLKKDLVDSGVFREKNINEADGRNLSDVKNASLILLDYWSLTEAQVTTVLANKRKSAGLVVYSPMGKDHIPNNISQQINNEPFTTLVNMRGRLVNDLLITLMSTSYDKNQS